LETLHFWPLNHVLHFPWGEFQIAQKSGQMAITGFNQPDLKGNKSTAEYKQATGNTRECQECGAPQGRNASQPQVTPRASEAEPGEKDEKASYAPKGQNDRSIP
jgi:hypothetical protein